MSTIADVFIIESLSSDDEDNGRMEGDTLCTLLRLHRKNPLYRYVRTTSEFRQAVTEFARSKYRYLHISAHGNRNGMCTTNGEEIDYMTLAKLLSPSLENKRLFLSACSMVHEQMAMEIIPRTGCHSIVGPKENIKFTVATVFWPSVYHLMFSTNESAMKRKVLKHNLEKVAGLFEVNVGYFSKSASRGYANVVIDRKI